MNSNDFIIIITVVFVLGVGGGFLLNHLINGVKKMLRYYFYRPKLVKGVAIAQHGSDEFKAKTKTKETSHYS